MAALPSTEAPASAAIRNLRMRTSFGIPQGAHSAGPTEVVPRFLGKSAFQRAPAGDAGTHHDEVRARIVGAGIAGQAGGHPPRAGAVADVERGAAIGGLHAIGVDGGR